MQSEVNAGPQQCFPADPVASPPLPRIYCHPPSRTKSRQGPLPRLPSTQLPLPRIITGHSGHLGSINYVFRSCVLVLVGMWVSRVAMFSRRLPPSSVQGNDALHRLLDFSPWGANGDTVNSCEILIPTSCYRGGVDKLVVALNRANLTEHTNRKLGIRSG